MSDLEGFDPDDMNELEWAFSEIIADNEDGFVIEFWISKLSAKELVDLWDRALKGNRTARKLSLEEYGKIMGELRRALRFTD
jgi:hypothetical protein